MIRLAMGGAIVGEPAHRWTRSDWEQPSPARMYDYYLGGLCNFAPDRAAAERAIQAMPGIVVGARMNRLFLRRAVRFMVESGVRQFLDLGSGIPSVGYVHEVAQALAPEATVAYVDIDPVTVRHAEGLLSGNPQAAVLQANIGRADTVLGHPYVVDLLDFSRPVGLLLVSVLHFLPGRVHEMDFLKRYRQVLAPGSHLALTHLSPTDRRARQFEVCEQVYSVTTNPVVSRGYDELLRVFDGYDLLDPGLVPLALWRPEEPVSADDEIAQVGGLAGVGRVVVS